MVFALIRYPQAEENKNSVTVVRIWNVDTFEGGKGSRASFLKWVAKRVEKRREGAHFLVSSVTLEGAKDAFLQGNYPDIISFGVGLWEFAEKLLPIDYCFVGGELQGQTLAYPWCRGGYALFCLENDFDKEGKTVLSAGGVNLTEVSAYLYGITGEVEESTAAYAKFLKGKYRYLLGTQRDLNRFLARGVEVFYKPLSDFCDLYQYVGVLSVQKKRGLL